MPQTLKNFINGEFVTPAGTGLLEIVNPTNGEVVAHAPVVEDYTRIKHVMSALDA